uniref:Uncharacterized protein n=1 Tax=Lactuca sativa TaxID=4236 RepID=A0A9R1XE98_LACSA|nr:hypothetical protein LSAT_V11C400199580 [Lactuca sativa]
MELHRRMQKLIPRKMLSLILFDVFQVFDFGTTFVVDLNCQTYPCRKWCSLGIACGCTIATSCYSNIIKLGNMDDVFRTKYEMKNVHPIPPLSEWEISDPWMVCLLSIGSN